MISNHRQNIVQKEKSKNCYYVHIKYLLKGGKPTKQTIYSIKVNLPKSNIKPKHAHSLAT